jgi:hypothetical protein
VIRPIIKLNEAEIKIAMDEGKRAEEECANYKTYNVNVTSLIAHQVGGAAELAVNKYFGLEWRGFNVKKRHDPDAGVAEVRATKQKYGRLILNQRDEPKKDRPFIHVMSLGNAEFKLMGWLYGYEVMLDENIFKRPQFIERLWVVENHRLRSVEELLLASPNICT